MKKTLIAALAFVVLMMTGTASALTTVDLIADGGDAYLNVGNVDVSIVGDDFVVTYDITLAPWAITETHVDVQSELGDIPQTGSGNPKVGKFAHHTEHAPPGVTLVTHTIPLINIPAVAGETVVIAAHAVVEVLEWDEVEVEWVLLDEETAWGEGSEFAVDRNWSMYFEYTIPLPDLIVAEIILNSATVYADDPFAFTFTIKNIGGEGPAENPTFDVAGYLSTDAVLDGSDTMILGPDGSSGTYSVWTYHLSVGWSHSLSISDGDITETAPGTYYLIVDADTLPGQAPNFYPGVEESDEDNNWLAIEFEVLAPPAP